MGRTGKWFAFEHFGILPDIMTVAKGLDLACRFGCVQPAGANETLTPGSHGGTYGGNAVAAAAAVATIQVMKEEDLLGQAKVRGEQLTGHLKHVQQHIRRSVMCAVWV